MNEPLHCWVNENGELQIEIDSGNPRIKAALCLDTNDKTLTDVCRALLWAMYDGEETHRFPGRMITLTDEYDNGGN